MALTTTTLSSAVAVGDNSIVVASATGFAAGNLILVDQETMQVAKSYSSGTTIPVLRGQDGSQTASHKASANVTTFLASDESGPPAQGFVQFPKARLRDVLSYSAAGAITLPSPGADMVAIINGTGALAMTIANPTKDMDGSILIIVGNGKAAHTVTYTAGLGNAGSSYDVGTFDTLGQCSVMLIAANAIWVPLPSPFSGTLTAIDVAIA